MALLLVTLVGLGMAVVNGWHRLGRSRRARAWSHSPDPDTPRHILVMYPLFALACVLAGVVGLTPDSPVRALAAALFLLCLLTALAYFFLPIPVPRFVQPRWYVRQEAGKRGARG